MEDKVEILENEQQKPKTSKGKLEVFDWLEIIVASVIIVTFLFTFVFKVIIISGDSMLNTLHNGERIIISNLFYTPERGDIVVISRNADNSTEYQNNETCIIKRVIATEGQTVNIINGRVYVDNELLSEDYIQGQTFNIYNAKFPQTVPENCVFVLGDNREHSRDSRDSYGVGMVEKKTIIGRALFRLFPFNNIGKI